jgi:putative membrane protein
MTLDPDLPHDDTRDRNSKLAWLRTMLAIERTLAAWMRTAVSLIGFGFTIFQFFKRLDDMPGIAKPRMPGLSEDLSLALVAAGTIGLSIALIEYRAIIRHLWSPPYRDLAGPGTKPSWSPTGAAAIVLVLIGLFALLMMVVRMT